MEPIEWLVLGVSAGAVLFSACLSVVRITRELRGVLEGDEVTVTLKLPSGETRKIVVRPDEKESIRRFVSTAARDNATIQEVHRREPIGAGR